MSKKDAIWLFAGGPMQEIAAQQIKRKGYQLIITDRNASCVCSQYGDEIVELDTFDISGNLEAASGLKEKFRIKAVISPAADCHETVAHVGRFLHLHAIDPEISHACRHKDITRSILTDARILQPIFATVSNAEEARIFIQKLGGQAVIKATDNSGSRGFRAINGIDELTDQVFEKALAEGTTGKVLVEEMMRPVNGEIAEQSVETVWYNGKMYWLNWVDRLFRKDFLFFDTIRTSFLSDISWGVEIGHINPAIHSYEIKTAVFDIIHRAGMAIGMNNEKGGHILKADIMLTNKGPCIIEITPRCSGGWDSSGTTPKRGADFIGGVVELALGIELDLNLWHTYFEFKNPSLFASILANIDLGATDCIGRRFAIGSDFDREKSLEKALKNLMEERYVV